MPSRVRGIDVTARKPDLAYLAEFEQVWNEHGKPEGESIVFTNGASGDFMHAQVRLLLQDFRQLQSAHADEVAELNERIAKLTPEDPEQYEDESYEEDEET